MALQGSIESFAIADVLRLLGASAKVGRLVVTGDRGTASVWVDHDGIVAGSPSFGGPPDLELTETVLDLLRFRSGAFVFEADVHCDLPGAPVRIDEAVDRAESALRELDALSELIPSTDVVVSMVSAIDGPTVTIDQAAWTVLAQLGGGVTVAELGRRLDLDDVELFRRIAWLVELGVAQVGEALPFFARRADHVVPVAGAAPGDAEAEPGRQGDEVWDGAVWGIPLDTMVAASAGSDPHDTEDDAPGAGTADPSTDAAATVPVEPPALVAPRIEADVPDGLEELFGDFDPFAPLEPATPPSADLVVVDGPDAADAEDAGSGDVEPPADDEEIARQLAMLSPRAAQAVATAAADRAHGADDASEEADDGREHLIRFLDSVN